MATPYEIVLIGANMGGVPMAHYLLKHTIPQLSALDKSHAYHLTIISPNTSYYWKIASPRALVSNDLIPTSTIIKPFSEVFASYPKNSYTHVQGKAVSVDPATKTVTVKTSQEASEEVKYDSLIVATGSHYDSALWTTEYGEGAVREAHERLHKILPSAKTVLIAGGGPVGVETAGEIAAAYPKLDITLLSGSTRLLQRLPPKVSAEAERQLKSKNVKVVHGKKVKSSSAADGGPATVQLGDGSQQTVDVFINAIGGAHNTEFLPQSWLEDGMLKTDKDTLRAVAKGAEGVYGLGDVNNHSNKQSMYAVDGVRPVASSLLMDVIKNMPLSEKDKAAAKPENAGLFAYLMRLFGFGTKKSGAVAQVQMKTMEGTQIIPIAKSGTGTMMGWKMPGWMVHQAKGKTYFTQMIDGMVSGKVMEKA